MEQSEIIRRLKQPLSFVAMKELASGVVTKNVKCIAILQLCEHKDDQLAFRASWTLEFIAYNYDELFLNNLPDFLELYPKINNYSVQRSFTKILMLLTHRKNVLQEKTEVSMYENV